MSVFVSEQARRQRVTDCAASVTLRNFQSEQRPGRKIGSVWLRPFKSGSNNLHSPAVRARPLCSAGRGKEDWELQPPLRLGGKKSASGHRLSSRKCVYSNLPDLTPHCRSDTFLPSPTLCWKSQLLPISCSRSTGTPSSPTAPLPQIPFSPLRRGTALPP